MRRASDSYEKEQRENHSCCSFLLRLIKFPELNAYFAFYNALPSFRLARANDRLVVTNHRLAGANNELSEGHRLQLHTADVKSYTSASQEAKVATE
ncbi:hypothetical protein [Alloprevotella tannerae]|uniref:hypothetical protein n=1 Tax=Alloprevotella tannerae TaxID=76122 RepID=UPI0028E899FC|nr:hypothetical protein [Alloprevotella tannerae]